MYIYTYKYNYIYIVYTIYIIIIITKLFFCFTNLDSFNSLKSHHFFYIHVTSLDSTHIISIYIHLINIILL